MTYRAALAFLDGLVNYERQAKSRNEFKLDNIRRLLEQAGNPQQRVKNVILVAGTKGKGSVCYMLEAALRGCGLSTGLFVSPHVLDIRERIQLGGKPVSKSTFAHLVEQFQPLVRRQPVSYFELTTAMAFEFFARENPDYSIIEVGLGGRLDATNLSDPRISVITRIGYDHLKVLGNTLTKIAGEKAGIMRQGRPVVISEQKPEALAALIRKARAAGARLIRAPSVVSVLSVQPSAAGLGLRVRSRLGSGCIRLPLLGRHQVENCQTALAVLVLLARNDRRIIFARVRRGLGRVSIPARCQVIRQRPFIVVDSCHNPESGLALANVLRDHLPFLASGVRSGNSQSAICSLQCRKVVLVYGSLSGKLVERTVAPLAPFVHQAILVQPDSPRAMPLTELSRIFRRLHIPFITAASVPAALALARQSAICNLQSAMPSPVRQSPLANRRSPIPIVVAGSFYLAGETLKLLGPSRPTHKSRPRR